jgi:hypothetical protein
MNEIYVSLEKVKIWERYMPDKHKSEEIYEYIISLIESFKHFTLFRLGDGDIQTYLNMSTVPVDESDRLNFNTIINPLLKYKIETLDTSLIIGLERYTICMNAVFKRDSNKTSKFYEDMKLIYDLNINSVVFMHMYVYKGLQKFFNSLEKRNVIIVGRDYLKNIDFKSKSKHHIITNKAECWKDQKDLEEQVQEMINKIKDPVIIYACALSAKMLISKMFFNNKNITQIDIGSGIDPYAGIKSRPWHENEKIKKHK